MEKTLYIPLICLVITAVVFDVRYQKIPNLLTFPAMLLGLGYYALTGGWGGLLFSLAGLGAGLAVFILLFIKGAMGAGDAKLMGAIGALVGVQVVLNAALCTVLAGGVYALLVMLFRYRACQGVRDRLMLQLQFFTRTGRLTDISRKTTNREPKLCYGVAIAAGTFFVLGWQAAGRTLPL